MGSDQLRVPKVGTSASFAMVAEKTAIPESNLTFAAALFVARKLAGLVRASNEWLSDSLPDGRLIVEQDLLREMAQLLHEQFFTGDGSAPDMPGILNWSGVNETAGEATLDDIAEAIARVEAAYATPSAVFLSPYAWGAIRRERDGDGGTGRYQLQPDASGATRPKLFGVDVFTTPHVGSNIVVADMRFVGVGVRDRWTVHYDPYRYSEYDQPRSASRHAGTSSRCMRPRSRSSPAWTPKASPRSRLRQPRADRICRPGCVTCGCFLALA